MLTFREYPIGYYVDRLKNSEYFAFPGFSDAEWFCILGQREGEKSGAGQVLSKAHGARLATVLSRNANNPRWLPAVPKCIESLPFFNTGVIERFLEENNLTGPLYERDMVLDDLARDAGLFPLIDQLRKMRTVVIGPAPLRGLDFLGYDRFVEVSTPNLHLEPDGIERAIAEAAYGSNTGWAFKPAVYLVSAGVSAAVIIDGLLRNLPYSSFIDCGSIWDAFVGIGGQRQWRAELYACPARLEQWKRRNLCGPTA